jgi:hypothetical protein
MALSLTFALRIDSAALLIESAAVRIDSAALLIESAAVRIESGLRAVGGLSDRRRGC